MNLGRLASVKNIWENNFLTCKYIAVERKSKGSTLYFTRELSYLEGKLLYTIPGMRVKRNKFTAIQEMQAK